MPNCRRNYQSPEEVAAPVFQFAVLVSNQASLSETGLASSKNAAIEAIVSRKSS
jgi:hypothetical protein